MQAKSKYQYMMILWKWEDLDTHVNDKFWASLSEDQQHEYLTHPTKGEGLYYQEYPVAASELCPNATLIAASIYQSEENEQSTQLLDALISHYTDQHEDFQFMLFLHRGNNYSEKDIDRLFRQFKDKLDAVFLFANGRDHIYYEPRRGGLLDDVGFFFRGIDNQTGEVISVERERVRKTADGGEEKFIEISQPYFDRVWRHYLAEFELKVHHLKEDLFAALFPYLAPNAPQEIAQATLVEEIKKADDGLLMLRLRSFADYYRKEVLDELKMDIGEQRRQEKRQIEKREKHDRVSYLFDDCIANLENQKNNGDKFISSQYEECKTLIDEIFLTKNTDDAVVSRQQFRKLLDKMNYLVKIIPGEMN